MRPGDLVDRPDRLQAGQLVEVMCSLPLWRGDRGFGTGARIIVHPPELLLCLGLRDNCMAFLHRGTPVLMTSPDNRYRFHELRLVR